MSWGDDFEDYHQQMMEDPVYAAAYRRASVRRVQDARFRRVVAIMRRTARRRRRR